MSDTLAWCRTERWNLSFSELVIWEQLGVYWRRCFCFLGSARLFFSLPRQLLLLLSTSRSSPFMNESMFCSQSTSTQKVARKRRGVQEHVRKPDCGAGEEVAVNQSNGDGRGKLLELVVN